MGELQARGPWVASGYYNDSPKARNRFTDGWLRTGDVAAIDAEGYIQIMDRTKDMVKSGGEWISSVDLENAIMAHPKVAEAAVVGVFHPKWQERPLACVVPHAEHRDRITKQEILDFLAPRVAKWWLPDDVVFIEARSQDQRRQIQQARAAGTVQGLHSAHGEDLRSRRVADASEPVS